MPGHLGVRVFVHLPRSDASPLPLAVQIGPQRLKDKATQLVAFGDVPCLALGNVVGPVVLGEYDPLSLRKPDAAALLVLAGVHPVSVFVALLPNDMRQHGETLGDLALHPRRHFGRGEAVERAVGL